MMKMGILACVLCLSTTSAQATELVNLVRLLADGVRYDGQDVTVSGYVCSNEGAKDGLFLTLQDCKDGNYDNAVQIENRAQVKQRQGLVRVRAIYRYKEGAVSTGEYQWGSPFGDVGAMRKRLPSISLRAYAGEA